MEIIIHLKSDENFSMSWVKSLAELLKMGWFFELADVPSFDYNETDTWSKINWITRNDAMTE